MGHLHLTSSPINHCQVDSGYTRIIDSRMEDATVLPPFTAADDAEGARRRVSDQTVRAMAVRRRRQSRAAATVPSGLTKTPSSLSNPPQAPDTYALTPEEIAAYEAQGYLRLPGFLTEAEVAVLEEAFDKIMRGEVPIPGRDFCDMVTRFLVGLGLRVVGDRLTWSKEGARSRSHLTPRLKTNNDN